MDHFDLIGCAGALEAIGDGTDNGDDRVRSSPVFREFVGIAAFERWNEDKNGVADTEQTSAP